MKSAQLRSSDWLRKNVIDTLIKREKLLDKWRDTNKLTSIEQQAVWLLLSDLVYSTARKHYKAPQRLYNRAPGRQREWYEVRETQEEGYTAHTDRILILAEFLKKRKEKSVGWCIIAYKRRFAQFEEQRIQNSAWGVGGFVTGQEALLGRTILLKRHSRELMKQGIKVTPQKLLEVYYQALPEAQRPKYEHAKKQIAEFFFLINYGCPKQLKWKEEEDEDDPEVTAPTLYGQRLVDQIHTLRFAGFKVREVCAELGISKTTYYRVLRDYEQAD